MTEYWEMLIKTCFSKSLNREMESENADQESIKKEKEDETGLKRTSSDKELLEAKHPDHQRRVGL